MDTTADLQAKAAAGVVAAQRELGNRYRFMDAMVPAADRETAIAATLEAAVAWLERAAQGQDVEAMVDLADLLSMELPPAEARYAEARHWYGKAAAAGHGGAWVRLGMLQEQGLGGSCDMVAAADCYSRAGELGVAVAYYNLARLYQFGRGVAADREKAIGYYEKAMAAGDVLSAYYLAQFVAREQPERAMALWRQAWEGGVGEAALPLAEGLLKQEKSEEALPLLQATVRQGGALAQQAMQRLAEWEQEEKRRKA